MDEIIDQSIYQKHGYANRRAYLIGLSEEYGRSRKFVFMLANLLGPNEDFDGLVTSLQDSESDDDGWDE
jgi:hypothetical protein